METSDTTGNISRRVLAHIRFNGRNLARSRAVPGMDADDCEQALALDLVRRTSSFDPSRASFATFADRVVRHCVASLKAPTDRRRVEFASVSLETPVGGGDDNRTLGELLPETAPPLDDAAIVSLDMRRFVNRLPPALVDCCSLLLAPSIAAGARETAIHRSTAYYRIEQLRSEARTFGLGVYFERPADTSACRPVCGDNGADHPRFGAGRETMSMSNRSRPPRPSLLLAESDLRVWISAAQAGDTLEYHRGALAADRLAVGSRLSDQDRVELDRVANAVWQLAQAGRGYLLQRRHGDGDYSYLFVVGKKTQSALLAVAGEGDAR
jgi:hypothetical protein